MIDRFLARDFEKTRKWAEINKSLRELTDYDYDAVREQNARDIRDVEERFK